VRHVGPIFNATRARWGYAYNGSNRDEHLRRRAARAGIDFLKGRSWPAPYARAQLVRQVHQRTDPLDAATTYNYMRGYLTNANSNSRPIIDPFAR